MAHTVVGVFDSAEQAQNAVDALVRAGFSEGDLDVRSVERFRKTGDAVMEDEGLGNSIRNFFADLFSVGEDTYDADYYSEAVRRGGSVITVDVDDEARLERARQVLDASGAVNLDERVQHWRTSGWTGYDTGARPFTADEIRYERENLLPVMNGQFGTDTRDQESSRATSHVRVLPHRPIPRDAAPADIGMIGGRYEDHTGYRTHWDSHYAAAGGQYEDYAPAYQFGASLRNHARYAGRDWDTVEAEAHRDWEVRYPDSAWERFKDAVRHGWNSLTTDTSTDGITQPTTGLDTGLRDERVHASSAEFDDSAFRSDWQTRYATSGGRYEDYRPAYEYGHRLRGDTRYADRDWDVLEPEARRDWETRYPDSAWDRFKDAVRRGWERMTD